MEFANRAFDKVDVTVDFCNKKDWEHGEISSMGKSCVDREVLFE